MLLSSSPAEFLAMQVYKSLSLLVTLSNQREPSLNTAVEVGLMLPLALRHETEGRGLPEAMQFKWTLVPAWAVLTTSPLVVI